MKYPNSRQKIHLNYTYNPTYILPPDIRLHTSTKKKIISTPLILMKVTLASSPQSTKKKRSIFWEYLTMAIDGFGDKKKTLSLLTQPLNGYIQRYVCLHPHPCPFILFMYDGITCCHLYASHAIFFQFSVCCLYITFRRVADILVLLFSRRNAIPMCILTSYGDMVSLYKISNISFSLYNQTLPYPMLILITLVIYFLNVICDHIPL